VVVVANALRCISAALIENAAAERHCAGSCFVFERDLFATSAGPSSDQEGKVGLRSSRPLPVSCSSRRLRENVPVPRFFLRFSLLDVPYINRTSCQNVSLDRPEFEGCSLSRRAGRTSSFLLVFLNNRGRGEERFTPVLHGDFIGHVTRTLRAKPDKLMRWTFQGRSDCARAGTM